MVLKFFGAFFAGYKYESASQHRDPEQWVVPSDGRRSHCNVTFEIGFVGGMSVLTEVRYNHIQDKRPVPFPVQLLSALRRQKAHQKALEATSSSGCPCVLRGFVGEEDGQHITLDTKIIFEWLHVSKIDNGPYLCQIRYRDLITQGRPVPNCPMRLCRPGLVYTVEFLDQFAENICRGLRFCGLMHEGSSLSLERCLPAGGIDVLDQPVYWQFPSGALRCVSARSLHRSPGLGHTSWSASLLAS